MDQFEDYKQRLLTYLFTERSFKRKEIERFHQMTREEKIASDMLIADLTVEMSDELVYVLNAPNNYSKLRAGDRVVLKKTEDVSGVRALVLDANTDTITISADKVLDRASSYDMEIDSPELLDSLIGCLEGILPATPGASFLRMLSGEEDVQAEEFLRINPRDIHGFDGILGMLNSQQQFAVTSMLSYYPIHVLQGPPGTGKTQVLAATAIASSLINREVVVVANTHQAVNNALLKIRQMDKNVPIFKIGELLRAEGLEDNIHKFHRFTEYNEYSKENRRKKKHGYIIGMTIWGAITNLGLRTHSHFRPYMALVDEASLMPLTYASILGKCSSTICFFGDSRQMPPIFQKELEDNSLSESILDYCATKVEGTPVCVLPETHRMNKEITRVVSKAFYEPFGIRLYSSDAVAEKQFLSPFFELIGKMESVVFMDSSISTPMCKEENEGEAESVIDLLLTLLEEGHKANEIAVITPFRKQVRLLREKANERLKKEQIPLIDTVERLQGQDVNCIILTLAASNDAYINEIHAFIFNSNRLNVMVSRAKTKVVIYGCERIQSILKATLNL